MTARLLEDGAPLSVRGLERADRGRAVGALARERRRARRELAARGARAALARAGAVNYVSVVERLDLGARHRLDRERLRRVDRAPSRSRRRLGRGPPRDPRARIAPGRRRPARRSRSSSRICSRRASECGSRRPRVSVRRSCTCPDDEPLGACKHVAALAFVVADAIDREPSLFLLWRGCPPVEPAPTDPVAGVDAPGAASRSARSRTAPCSRRLGRSGIRVGGVDLADALARAYDAFAATRPSGA